MAHRLPRDIFQLIMSDVASRLSAALANRYRIERFRMSLLLVALVAVATQSPSGLERAVLEETNLARTDPSAYADHLEPMLDWFRGDVMFRPGSDVGIRTEEGRRAVREAIDFLRQVQPAPPLSWSTGLWRAARDHARDQGVSGATGHRGSDDSTSDQRMNRYGRWRLAAAENIDYGSDEARHVVISLIVDDGVSNRGHRRTIFDATLRVAGVGCGPHLRYRTVCVIDYAAAFDEVER